MPKLSRAARLEPVRKQRDQCLFSYRLLWPVRTHTMKPLFIDRAFVPLCVVVVLLVTVSPGLFGQATPAPTFTDPQVRFKGFEQHQTMAAASPFKNNTCDSGATWKNIAAGIPLGPINVVTEDPTNPKLLYVGTDLGVYVTVDGGTTWDVLGTNLPTNYVHDIVVHPRDRVIVAATHGRGMWVMDAIPVQGFKK